MRSKCTEETCLEPMKRDIHVSVDGKDVPIGRFVQGFLISTIIGMLSSLKKVSLRDGSLLEIKLRYKK